ncbi:protein-glutamate O-methyltransferase CheR [Azospirillum brasilense]|uniref:protein-glutamate O-methyltransferase n=2 Tax=Azospirillum brasilense TaxID=192 RepID=A0A0P0EUB4_AZOBR|nr:MULTISPECIES: CheR family methyltransferase [Azospirillum]ALJ37989.1 chemotaxis protein [Azospirillum brasilense]MDW7557601.1 CheR family methyltransferase [Azospirillum brasilense]MDW7595429.1 CheR family methyltransferase [Azospirillum brasilense]MDW7630094.1 CheR family methyltransferase [Azospirillum brasilense]MDX5951785.1 CheR family methyltransferase [Azospirillum brasilense]
MNRIDAILRDPVFPRIKAAVIGATGLAYYADKDAALAERINRRLSDKPTLGLSAYLALLAAEGPTGPEYQALINELTVGETFFFRYAEQFEALCAVAIPECLRRNQESRLLRIWSAGCSIGPEAYTLEILLKRHFADRLRDWQVSIVGTDLNAGFIETARRGVYGNWAVRGLDPAVLAECFDRQGDLWAVKPRFREWTSFSVFNLVEGPLPNYPRGLGALDVVLCRNVMIYFDEPTRTRLLENLHEVLVPNGWLVVGHAETGQQVNGLFTPVPVPGATIYRKPRPGSPPSAVLPAFTPSTAVEPPSAAEPKPAEPRPTEPKPARKRNTATESMARLRATAAKPTPAPLPAPQPPASSPASPAAADGDRAAALDACIALAERNRLDPVVHFRLGLLEEELGVGDPIAAFKRALYLDSDFALADYHLALAYWRRGKLAPAQRHFRNARATVAAHDATELVAEGGGLTVAELRSMIDLWFSGEEP